jgi:hypothetical protein
MPDRSIFGTPAPYHIVAYGALLGSNIFQSFVGGIVAYRSLPRPQFSNLQRNIFPIFFSMQTALPVLVALTYPGSKILATSNSLSGVVAEGNRWSVLIPLATVFATAAANLLFVGPSSTRIMKERYHQGMFSTSFRL